MKLRNKEEKYKYEEKAFEKMKVVKTDKVQVEWKEIVKACIERKCKCTDQESNVINAISDPERRAEKKGKERCSKRSMIQSRENSKWK